MFIGKYVCPFAKVNGSDIGTSANAPAIKSQIDVVCDLLKKGKRIRFNSSSEVVLEKSCLSMLMYIEVTLEYQQLSCQFTSSTCRRQASFMDKFLGVNMN
jgi:hypothetical protein